MATKQFGLKFDETQMAEWDAWRGARGLSRTEFFVTAARALVSSVESHSLAPQPESLEMRSGPVLRPQHVQSVPTASELMWERQQRLNEARRA